MSTPKIVILGAGYAGLVAALKLQKSLHYNEAEITLVNKHDYHYITTELHQPAAGTMHHDKARVEIEALIDTKKVHFIKDIVRGIDKDEKKVSLHKNGELSYDYLVIGLGSEPETFGIKGLLDYSLNIRTINSVRFIRQHIEYQFAKYKMDPEREDLLTFIVGGAGYTGIEFVGELADRIPDLCQEYDVDRNLVRIIVVEAAPQAIPMFDPQLVEYAMEVLSNKGVEFLLNTPIKECTPEGVILATDEEIKSATVVWTGGVRGSSLIEQSGFEAMRGRIKVDQFLRAPGHDDVFVTGDCALLIDEASNRPYPPTAQMAMQHGYNVSDNITALIRGAELSPFQPVIRGTVASLGRGEAIGIVGTRKLVGASASWMKKLIDMRYLYIIGGLPLVLKKGRF
jgi:NADH dehydrogenase